MMENFFPINSQNLSHDLKKLIIKYLHPIMAVNVYIQNLPIIRPDILKTVFFSAFFNCSILVFVRLSVTLIHFPFNFLLLLKIFVLTLYLEILMITGQGLFLSGFRLPKPCDLLISWCVVSLSISFF